jgi:rubrerythrin
MAETFDIDLNNYLDSIETKICSSCGYEGTIREFKEFYDECPSCGHDCSDESPFIEDDTD